MPAAPPLSAASRLVLADLAKADGKEVLKLAIKELVARGAFELTRTEERRRFGRARATLYLVGAGGPAAGDALLAWTRRAVLEAPEELHGTRVARELSAVAVSIASRDPKAKKHVVEEVLADLEHRGLVRSEERRVLGVVKRPSWSRTPEGEAELRGAAGPAGDAGLEDDRPGRRAFGPYAADGSGAGADGHDGDGSHHSGPDGALDGDMDSSLGSGLDSSFDGGFDSAFDAAFDSGFSLGGGDGGGGGGDGGGGGGGGGGDGGGGGGGGGGS